MQYMYLIISVFMNAASSILGQVFNRKNEGKTDTDALYNFFLMISVCFCWGILYALDFSFEPRVIWYSVLFAASYTVCNIGIINALKYGPTTLTSLFVGLSLILTTIWGFFFWNAKVTVTVIVGLLLVVVAVYLCLYTNEKEEKTFSWKWLFFVMLGFFGNAGCSIIQRTQQMNFGGQHGSMLMLFATVFSAIACFGLYVKSDKKDTFEILKRSWWVPVSAGACNVILNLFVMLMALTTLSSSLIYPVIGVGGIVVVTVVSLIVFKEKMYWWQWLGVGIGVVAIGILSV